MTKKELQKELENVAFETIRQKPKIDEPYPKEVVSLRSWLITAQALLGKIESKPQDGWILEVAHNKLMKIYEQDKQRLAIYF